jgi:hypothetical protein
MDSIPVKLATTMKIELCHWDFLYLSNTSVKQAIQLFAIEFGIVKLNIFGEMKIFICVEKGGA